MLQCELQVAVIARSEHGFLVDHAKAITRDVSPLNYQCKKELFELWTPYINIKGSTHDGVNEDEKCSKRKRKKQRTSELNEGEVEGIKHHNKIRDIIATSTVSLTSLGRKVGYFEKKQNSGVGEFTCAVPCAKDDATPKKVLPQSIMSEGKDSRKMVTEVVQHPSCSPCLVFMQDGWYILPPETTYLMSDASHMQPLIDLAKSKGLFDVLVVDPPWYNKSAKRSGNYSFMSLWQIKSLPVPQLLSHDALVAVWVTNKPKYIKFTREELLPYWGVELLAEWYWVKVTRTGELVVDLDSQHKKPYEMLIIGRCKATNNSSEETVPTKDSIQNHMVICSVPCQVHSRKPPLCEVLGDYANTEGNCLEMFARNLTPRWTSWGNEVLKFQHKDYFEETSPKRCSSE